MNDLLHILPIQRSDRPMLEAMATSYFAEVLPGGPPFVSGTLDSYWTARGRHPYLISLGDTPIGFGLVWTHPDGQHELAEFTIRRPWRHKGLGTQAAHLIFAALGGDWTLGVATASPGGIPFWRQCLQACEGACEITHGPPKTKTQCGSFTFRIER